MPPGRTVMPTRRSTNYTPEIVWLNGWCRISKCVGFQVVLLVVLVSSFLLVNDITAGVYKYKDENGVWHFTDTPDEEVYESAEQYIKDQKAAFVRTRIDII